MHICTNKPTVLNHLTGHHQCLRYAPEQSEYHQFEMADQSAGDYATSKIPYTDARQYIRSFSKWQNTWNNIQLNKLQLIKPMVERKQSVQE